ncbi:MAG: M20/M25/M40 family metallo-hydrolase [Anaerolineaceae bacterium]|nr:M20/M25/M40 family metallo-hydrolase [Anaerolineaceae bacterium]
MLKIVHFFSIIAIILAALVVPPNLDCDCGYDPLVATLLAQASQARWAQWIAELSGAAPIQTEDGEAVITSRSSHILFEPSYQPSAFDYLINELEKMGMVENTDFVIHTYDFPYSEKHQERNWKNLILTFPGEDPSLKDERVLMVAHLDSMSEQETKLAPGADDNATGAAGLLEAAYLLRNAHFARTINLIWFSGEEQSRRGSEYFVEDYADWLPDIQAVINLDMFGFDWDNDRCFEVHAGVLPGSQDIGACLADSIDAYGLDLRFDQIDDSSAYSYSDHNAFWLNGIPAVMVIENFSYQPDGVCGLTDRNYQYHRSTDIMTYINQGTGFSILQASLATLAEIAGPMEAIPDLFAPLTK